MEHRLNGRLATTGSCVGRTAIAKRTVEPIRRQPEFDWPATAASLFPVQRACLPGGRHSSAAGLQAGERHLEQFAVIVVFDNDGAVQGAQAARQLDHQILGMRPRGLAIGKADTVFIQKSGLGGHDMKIKKGH